MRTTVNKLSTCFYKHCGAIALTIFFWFFPGFVFAQEYETERNPWQWIDEGRGRISRNVTALGRNLDTWLAGESIVNTTNESYLRVHLNQQLSKGGDYHSRVRIGGSLDLPRTAERWKFIFESDSTELNTLSTIAQDEQVAGNSAAGFRFLQRAAGKLQLSHSIGIRGELPLDPYYRLRANFAHQLSDSWGLGVRQRIWHYDSEGWGYNTNVSFRRPLASNQILHFSTDVRYQQSRQNIEFGQTIALHTTLSESQTLSYEASAIGVSEPNRRINLYSVGAQYRQAVREDWLFLEFVPQLVMERFDSWKPQPRFSINLEMLFFDF